MNLFFQKKLVVLALVAALSVSVSQANALDLTGTWKGVQVCTGASAETIPCHFLSESTTNDGVIQEVPIYIIQDGVKLRAFSPFFTQHYNGVVVDTGCCQTFSLVDCSTDPTDLLNQDRIAEVAVFTLIDEDHFVGNSTVTGSFRNFGIYTENCTWSYRRELHTVPTCIIPKGKCGLFEQNCDAAKSNSKKMKE